MSGMRLLMMALCLLGVTAASAQNYPTKPIRIIVPFPAGGAADIQTRLFAESFGAALGQQMVVDNRAGAAGNIGTEAAARSSADGYTLVIGGPNVINNKYLYKTVPYDWEKDLEPLGLMFSNPNVLIVNNDVPARSVESLIAHLKVNPGKLNYGSSGAGGSIHLSALLFTMMTGTEMVHVPYRGDALARTDLLTGQIHVMFNALSSSLENIRAGKWRALATTGAERPPSLAELPTLEESGLKGYVVTSWQGLFAPKGLAPEIVARIRAGYDAVYKDAATLKRFDEVGTMPKLSTPAEHVAFMRAQEAVWAPVFKAANLTQQ